MPISATFSERVSNASLHSTLTENFNEVPENTGPEAFTISTIVAMTSKTTAKVKQRGRGTDKTKLREKENTHTELDRQVVRQ